MCIMPLRRPGVPAAGIGILWPRKSIGTPTILPTLVRRYLCRQLSLGRLESRLEVRQSED